MLLSYDLTAVFSALFSAGFSVVFSPGKVTLADSDYCIRASPLRVSNKWENGPEFKDDFCFFIKAMVFATTFEISGFL
jgi:hypothetical protein